MKGNDPIQALKGIGEKTAGYYRKLGIETIRDLVEYYPRQYEKYDDPVLYPALRVGAQGAVYAKLTEIPKLSRVRGLTIVTARWCDVQGNRFTVVWYNQAYLCKSLHTGEAYVLRGSKQWKGRETRMMQPQLFLPAKYAELKKSLLPVYPLTKGVTRAALMKNIQLALSELSLELTSRLAEEQGEPSGMMSYSQAVVQIHFPKTLEMFEEARKRLVLEEFFVFFQKMAERKRERENARVESVLSENREVERALTALPFSLTNGQMEAWQTIRRELCSEQVMHRLLQGDVGSGKTVLAMLAMLEVAWNGKQAVLMAPTAVLAKQHYETFRRLFSSAEDLGVELLTGATSAKEKKRIYEALAKGEVRLLVGTHAVFQEKVSFLDLALVITDEQHRFGVQQRHGLAEKGISPHVLYMSATPIPRSLAGVLYADLDVTLLTEKPAGRQKIHTCVISQQDRPKAYKFIKDQLAAGHQAYVICPLVEESEMMSGENVLDYAEQLKELFPNEVIGILHGRMKTDEKNDVMRRFSDGEIRILVSTTVVEVGVDVPNATTIMIENADRFGLAQLHQLRGRVGRGSAASYCILVNGSEEEDQNKRLQVMNESEDGFEIAAKDFQMRGPGDILGLRQSGDPMFRLADIYRDNEILLKARNMVMTD